LIRISISLLVLLLPILTFFLFEKGFVKSLITFF
jgi:hypothetical protein